MEVAEIYQLYKENCLVSTDTRKIKNGSIFFALKGENFNGNKFVNQAIENGASYCIIDDDAYFIKGKTILVDDALSTLQELANYHRNQLKIPIVALTGSNGKTTTKELINVVLHTQYNTIATIGNLNNHIGVPLTLLSFTEDTEIGIVEMGANHQKEIEFLCGIAEPDYGYITNFGKAHLEGFGGVEGVIIGKSELYKHLAQHNKTAFVNPDDEKQLSITKDSKRVIIDSAIALTETQPFLKVQYQDTEIKTNLVGSYNFKNIRAAIGIGYYFNIKIDNIKNAIESYVPKNNRSQVIEKKSNTILLDAYNANPSSMELALENFQEINHPKKVVILGDMFELGGEADLEHQAIANLALSHNFHEIYCVGENFYRTTAANTFLNFENLKAHLISSPIQDSYILIKGSRGMALERLLDIIS